MKKLFLAIIATLALALATTSCIDNLSNNPNTKTKLQEEEEKNNNFIGEWYEVNSTDTEGTKVVFTATNMSIYSFRKNTDYVDTLVIYAKELGYQILSDNAFELDYRPIAYTEFPNYKVNYTFKSADTLFIEKVWANNLATVYPQILGDILLCRRNK